MPIKPESKHAKVRRQLLKLVRGLQPNQTLPNERALADRFGVSRMTLRQVIAQLIDEGLIYSVHGVGTFVAEPRMSKEVLFSSFTEDMLRRGLQPSSKILTSRTLAASETVARALGVETGALVQNLERLRLADDVPVCIENAYFPSEELSDLLLHDVSNSVYSLLRDDYRRPIVRAVTTVSALALSRRDAELLNDRVRAPALRFERVGFDQRGTPLEYCIAVYRSGQFDLRYTVDVEQPDSSVSNRRLPE